MLAEKTPTSRGRPNLSLGRKRTGDNASSRDGARAFSIASKFARLGPQRAAIMRAQAARLSPGLYRQLGRDPAAIIEAGKAAMRERFEAR
jgi:hypothetical protein